MTCQELFELLHDFTDGDLVTERCESIKIHIAGCERCEIIVHSYRTAKCVGRALPKCPLTEAFKERLRACLEPHLNKVVIEGD